MTEFLAFTVVGVVTGSVFAVSACGLVVTYTTSGIFNFAHGAIGMLAAFVFWELSENRGLPSWLALAIVIFAFAPGLGSLIERILMRQLRGSSTAVSLVVTIGLLVFLLGAAQSIWPQNRPYNLPPFFAGHDVSIAGVVVTFHDLTIVVTAGVVALLLRFFLYRTRTGVTMRAVVDNRDLVGHCGAEPERFSQFSWAIGAALAAVAGILLAPALQLNAVLLTLLVVNGYAAAMLGRLTSLPLTFVGGLILGLLEAYAVGYGSSITLGGYHLLAELKPALPTLFLFAVLVFLPQARLRGPSSVQVGGPAAIGLRTATVWAVTFIGFVMAASAFMTPLWLFSSAMALVTGMVMLSLVLLTGYAGQVSLCQFSFVGVGAFAMGRWFGGDDPVGLLAAGVLAAALGLLVSLPAMRVQDLYLALSTLAVAVLMDTLFFDDVRVFDRGGSLQVDRLRVLGLDMGGERTQLLLAAVAFAATGLMIVAIRSRPFGRRLRAMSDSPAAVATLGMDVVRTKAAVFSLSAGVAGLAGALLAGLQSTISAGDFTFVQSLLVFLIATVGGITSVTGALLGGVILALLPVVQDDYFRGVDLMALTIGAGAITLGRNPHGIAGLLLGGAAGLRRFAARTRSAEADRQRLAQEPVSVGT